MKNEKHSIGKTITTLRKKKGWTQGELAEKLNVSDKAVSKWENEESFPSIEFFPAIAKLFDVSIDYLMTGKELEPEIIAMSKIELCAKKDDVDLFESLGQDVLQKRDENGKNIFNYMLKYNCKNVTRAFFKKYRPANYINSGFFADNPEQIMELLIRNNMVEELEQLGAFNYEENKWFSIRNKRYSKLFLSDVVSEELREKYFNVLNSSEINEAFDAMLDADMKPQIEMLWNTVKNINEQNIAKKEETEKNHSRDYMTSIHYRNYRCVELEQSGTSNMYSYFVVTFQLSLIEKFLGKGFYDIAKQANDFNARIGKNALNKEKFEYAKAVSEKTADKDNLAVLKVTVDGIIDIKALLEIKDLAFVKKTLLNNSIHFIEILYKDLKQNNRRALLEYFIDNKLDAEAVLLNDTTTIERNLMNAWRKDDYKGINRDYLRGVNASDLEELISKIQLCKQQILNEYCWELDKEKTIGELTKEYFEKELEKGNTEMVVIKLCVRLEAVLRSDYHYEGDFSEMMDWYCNEHGGDVADYLHKLRKCRNSIVHSERHSETLSIEEIKYCIDYICNMG